MRTGDNIIFNIGDTFNTNNIGGFNISNFKVKFMESYAEDVIKDYL